MKKKLLLPVLMMVVVSTVFFNGCKKKDNPEPTKTELLTNKNWKVTALTSDPAISINGVLVTNVYNQMDQCDKDDLRKFTTNGVYTFDEGLTKCNVNDPQTETGTWSFNSDQTIITVTLNGSTSSYTIESFGESTMKGNTVFNDGANNYTFSYTWTKQ